MTGNQRGGRRRASDRVPPCGYACSCIASPIAQGSSQSESLRPLALTVRALLRMGVVTVGARLGISQGRRPRGGPALVPQTRQPEVGRRGLRFPVLGRRLPESRPRRVVGRGPVAHGGPARGQLSPQTRQPEVGRRVLRFRVLGRRLPESLPRSGRGRPGRPRRAGASTAFPADPATRTGAPSPAISCPRATAPRVPAPERPRVRPGRPRRAGASTAFPADPATRTGAPSPAISRPRATAPRVPAPERGRAAARSPAAGRRVGTSLSRRPGSQSSGAESSDFSLVGRRLPDSPARERAPAVARSRRGGDAPAAGNGRGDDDRGTAEQEDEHGNADSDQALRATDRLPTCGVPSPVTRSRRASLTSSVAALEAR